MLFTEVIVRLELAFARELPGVVAQGALAPVPRRQWPSGFNPARVRHAAGLLLLFPAPNHNAKPAKAAEQQDALRSLHSSSGDHSDHAHVVLTVRADTLERHGGQVSLPGGVVEPGESFEQAALREAHEEIALPLDGVRVLGALTPLDIPVSGFRLHPIVAARTARPALTPSDGEVARILEIDVDELLQPSCVRVTQRERDGRTLTVPGFHLHDVEIWGATAMVLAEFLALLGWSMSPR
jgi:8-oxo-dGTP pyrophosphatase MutT (NUDIX family)